MPFPTGGAGPLPPRRSRWLSAAALFLLLAPCGPAAAAPPAAPLTVVVADGEARLGEQTTPAQARALALNNARRSAVEQAAGLTLHGISVVYDHALIGDLVSAFSRGLIVREEILAEGLRGEGKQALFQVRLRAHIRPLPAAQPGENRILRAEVARAGGEPSQGSPVFQHNDEIQIRVRLAAAAYLSLFSVDQEGRLARLYPNPYVPPALTGGGEELLFPAAAQRAAGLRLRVHAPPGLPQAFETVLVVATATPRDFLAGNPPGEAVLTDLMQELAQLDPTTWTQTIIGYEVRR